MLCSATILAASLGAVLAAGCGTDEPPLTDATSLQCPTPGRLPFRLKSSGYQQALNKTLVTNDPRIKDEASDTIGNPGGIVADIYLDDAATPASTPVDYLGVKARTTPMGGLVSSPLTGENVSLWTYDGTAWQTLGRDQTDSDGHYEFSATGFVAANGHPVYSMLEADASCAEQFNYLLAPGSKFVVTDIDGTLTTADAELLMQVGDATYVPAMMTAANTLMQTWAMKGYPIVYLTARPHVFRTETRGWLEAKEFPTGPVITSNSTTDAADAYKTIWLKRMITDFGWTAVAAYGNASTDITAYANAGIPPDQTFIIGGLGGMGGTISIPTNDYTQHIMNYVDQQPDNH